MPAEDHFEQTVPVRTVGECAEKCAGQGTNCSRAQFDPNESTVGPKYRDISFYEPSPPPLSVLLLNLEKCVARIFRGMPRGKRRPKRRHLPNFVGLRQMFRQQFE